jgi:hypothetical protein
MCVTSFIGDNFQRRTEEDEYWKKLFKPDPVTNPYDGLQQQLTKTGITIDLTQVTRIELDALKREVEQLKQLLIGAVEYDKKNNEPHCEMDTKVELIKQIGKALGVDLENIFNKEN